LLRKNQKKIQLLKLTLKQPRRKIPRLVKQMVPQAKKLNLLKEIHCQKNLLLGHQLNNLNQFHQKQSKVVSKT